VDCIGYTLAKLDANQQRIDSIKRLLSGKYLPNMPAVNHLTQ